MVKLIVDIVGWIGAGGVLAAYVLVSTGRVPSASYSYQLLNLIGATGLAVNTFYYMSYPSTALNAIWALIAVYAVHKLWKARKEATPVTQDTSGP
jgi:hypothetical protein